MPRGEKKDGGELPVFVQSSVGDDATWTLQVSLTLGHVGCDALVLGHLKRIRWEQ